MLIFTWGIPEIPVDVHVHRVGGRLGLFPEGASFEKAHDEMLAIVDPEDAYELHMNLIRHGREVCRPKPRCGECELRRMCPWYRAGASVEQSSKKTFVVFGLLVVVLAVLIPWLAFRSDGDAARGAQKVPADLKDGQALFQTNCGTCHTLYAAGTDGNFAPDLDELLAPSGPPKAKAPRSTIDGVEETRPQRDRKRRRQHDHSGPDAGRDPQRRTGRSRSPNSSPAPPAATKARLRRPSICQPTRDCG